MARQDAAEEYLHVLDSKNTQAPHRLSPAQRRWVIFWPILGIAVWTFGLHLVGFLCLLMTVGALPTWRGPLFKVADWMIDSIPLRRRGGRVVTNQRKLARKKPIDIHIQGYGLDETGTQNVGVLYTKAHDTAITLGNGWPSASLVGEEKYFEQVRLSRGIVESHYLTDQEVSLTTGFSAGAFNPIYMLINMRLRSQPAVLEAFDAIEAAVAEGRPIPRPQTTAQRQALVWFETLKLVKIHGRNVRTWVAVTIKRPTEWGKKNINNRLSLHALRNAPIVRVAQQVARSLEERGVNGVRTLTKDELMSFVRTSWDINPEEWYNRVATDSTPPNDQEIWPDWQLAVPRDLDGKLYLDFGTSVHRVRQAIHLDGQKFPPDRMISLFETIDFGPGNETGLTISLSGDLYSASDVSKRMNFFITIQQALLRKRFDTGYHVSDRQQRDNVALMQRQRLVDSDNAPTALFYNLYVVTSATSIKVLEEVDRRMLAHAREVGIKLREEQLEARLVDQFFAAVLGVGGV